MKNSSCTKKARYHLPAIGQRITKTSIAVFLCLIIYYLLGYRGSAMSAEAAITAIVCIQPYARDSRASALNRLAGSLIGVFWGLVFLLPFLFFPQLGKIVLLVYALMGLGTLLSLYTAVALHIPDSSGLAAIVYICVVIAFPDIDAPLVQAWHRIVDIGIGTLVAVGVNLFRLPREKHPERVIFVRSADLLPDRFTSVTPATMLRLNYLYQDGAKLCLMSEHAPAFLSLQLQETRLQMPMIVMDGAALYDPSDNRFLYFEPLPTDATAALKKKLDALGMSHFIYTIHKNRICIFHRGELRAPEKLIYDHMRRSPYRSYLEGELYEPEEVVYFKLIAVDADIRRCERELEGFLQEQGLRSVVRPQSDTESLEALYIYSAKACMRRAQNVLLAKLREKEPDLVPVEVHATTPCINDHDTQHMLHLIGTVYEPVKLFGRRKKK